MVATLLDPLPFLVNGPSTAAAPNSDRTAWLRDQPGILHLVSGQEQEAALENIEALLWTAVSGGAAASANDGNDGTDPPPFLREMLLQWV